MLLSEVGHGAGTRPLLDGRALEDGSYGRLVQVRVARQSGRLAQVVAFYRDGLGLPEVTRFEGHAGYDGVVLDLPGTGAHLEFTATGHTTPPVAHPEGLLVLYLGSQDALDRALSRLDAQPVASANPYWDQVGVTVRDPDGFGVVLVPAVWPTT